MNAGPVLLGVPVAFVLFALTLVGVALFSRRSLEFALAGFAALLVVRIAAGFDWVSHLHEEAGKTLNLFGLLVGFAMVADHFEKSRLPDRLPRWLPRGSWGAFVLLVFVGGLSGVLDNIAAALIGAAAASRLFARLHPGYVAAIVAAANAGGAGSVIGDTTTTMMWIDGVHPTTMLPAYLAAAVALVIVGAIGARQQTRHAAPIPQTEHPPRLDQVRVVVVVASLVTLAGTNLLATLFLGRRAEDLPLLAAVLWVVLLIAAGFRRFDRRVARRSARAALFLVLLVLAASLLPVQALPHPSFLSTVGLGFVSAVFDNIPLTKVALLQGGYDWPFLAYSVGFGGSMLWFGSSAGVAVSEIIPSVRSVGTWMRAGWHIPLAFLAGHAALYLVRGWHP